MSALHEEIKALIISALNLEDITPEDIEDDMPLFSEEGLGLDSIDGLELGLALKKKYAITLSAENEETRHHFESVNALVKCIESFQQNNH